MYRLEVKLPGNKHHSILNLCSGGAVKAETAKMIADVLEMSATAIFRYETDSRPLRGYTVGGYHTQASLLFFNGIDSVSISYRLGHAHVSTTTDIYSNEAELHWDQGDGGTYQRLRGGCDFETGEGEAEGNRGLRESNNSKHGMRLHLGTHPISFYQYCFTCSLDSLSDK